jgi:hypothetical protein
MATIPIGDFGQAIARPMPRPNIPRGDALGQAAEQTGRTALDVGLTVASDRTRNAQQEDLELQAKAEEQRRKDEDAAKAAQRARTIVELTGTKDALQDLHDEVSAGVLNGQTPKEKAEAEFTTRAKKVLEGFGKDMPEDTKAIALAELGGNAARLGNGVRKAVTARDRHDVTAGIDQTLEYLQRQYKADPGKATAQAMATVDQLGPHSTYQPEQLAKLKQGWKEGTQYTAAFELVSAGRNDRKMLDAADKMISGGLPDLDPRRRAELSDRVASYRLHLDQKAEMAAQRAQREAERRLSKAQAEFQTFQAMADKGTALDPAFIDTVLKATAGTPFQAGVRMLAQQARDTGGLAAQPVRAQQALLDQVNATIATQGRSPELDRRKEQVEKVLRGSQQDLERDPLRAGLERGVIAELAPLDLGKGVAGLALQLQQRAPLAERVGIWAGRAVSPLTEEEAAQVKHQLDSLPAKERAGMVAALAQAAGPQAAQGMARQMDKNDKALALAFAYSGAQTTAGRYTSELVMRGAQAKQDGTSTKGEKQPDLKVTQWSAHIANELKGLFPAQTMTNQTREAALLIAHGLASEGGGRLTTDDLDRSVRLAIGGTVVEHNGRKVALPAGVSAGGLETRLKSVSVGELQQQAPDGMVRAAGQAVPLAEFTKALPGQQLLYAGPGRFSVLVGELPVVNSQGRPIIIGVQ